MNLLKGDELKLREMKAFLNRESEMLLGEERARNEPNVVLRVKL